MSELRERVARAIWAEVETGVYGIDYRTPWEYVDEDDRFTAGLIADAAIAAIESYESATPGPAPVSEADAISLLRTWVDGEIDALTKRFLTPHEYRELTGARLTAFGEFQACIREVSDQLAARTTARAPEPTETEVNAAVSAMTTHVWLHRPQEAMRAALIAARKAGRQGGERP